MGCTHEHCRGLRSNITYVYISGSESLASRCVVQMNVRGFEEVFIYYTGAYELFEFAAEPTEHKKVGI